MNKLFFAFLSGLWIMVLSGCYVMRPSAGGAQGSHLVRQPRAQDIAVPSGYQVELVAQHLTFPTGVAFDGSGKVYVVESGYCYGEVWTTPRLLKVEPDGRTSQVVAGTRNGPWNGVTFSRGTFYIAEGGVLEGGRILKASLDGKLSVLIDGLPSLGDHHTNGPVMGPDGFLYFGQGTASNSGIVGEDSAKFGWLKRHPEFHDIPGEDVVLSGQNFITKDVVKGTDQKVQTGAFLPFGTSSQPNQVIKGQIKCSGSILRIRPSGGDPELVAWGFRNPFGLAFSPEGQLFVSDNGYDDRGSRPLWGTPDVLWEVQPHKWYGWPDYSGGEPFTDKRFKPPGKKRPGFVLAHHPNVPPQPVARFGIHSSANGFDFSRNEAFGHVGEAFVALFGDEVPATGKLLNPVGFKVVRVNVRDGSIEPFAVNRGNQNGPASKLKSGGLERPVAVRFDPDGKSLYVVDFGILTHDKNGAKPQEGTGTLWKITRQ